LGIAFASDHSAWVSEGNSGKVGLMDWTNQHRRTVNLNTSGFTDSFTGDLAFDPERNLLYVVDQANFRVAVIDGRSRQVMASIKVGRLPFAVTLSPDRRKLYITNVGMLEYQVIPGADSRQPSTGIPFPAFGFPSAEGTAGAKRTTGSGPVAVPGLGDPSAKESNSVAIVDVATPAAPKLESFIRTGLPFGAGVLGGSNPSGILAAGDRIFVSNSNNDTITVIDSRTKTVTGEIPIRIPGLESLRGVLPLGLAYHEKTGWLLAAEAGINAVAVIDPREKRVLGHLPAAWYPTRVAISGDTVFVANGRGWGQGPNAPGEQPRHGSVSIFPLPGAGELAEPTRFVLEANGFRQRPEPERKLPSGIQHVVLIVKSNRSYDEVFGDVAGTMGAPEFARFGMRGYADGERKRVSMRDVAVTPNHHALARQWAIGDNFYADGDGGVAGHHWLAGAPPTPWTESSLMAAYGVGRKDFRLGNAPGRLLFAGSASSVHPEEQPESGGLWHHLERNGIAFRNFGEGFDLAGVDQGKDLEPSGARFHTNVPMPDALYRNTSREYPGFNLNVPDQFRAAQFIKEIDERYVRGGAELPRFIFVRLPNDRTDAPRPTDGYPYRESYIADNDYALGRIIEYLSGTKWWKEMAVFVTEAGADGGADHVDAHRTVLMAMGPWIKRGYVSHRNSSFPGLLKTIFRLLGAPALNLFDAAATDLSDLFASQADPAGYKAAPVDPRLFDPSKVGRQ
jgi:YVTN family beta-propeller protein